MARVEAELRQRFDASAATLGASPRGSRPSADAARAAPRDQAALKRLFDAVDAGPARRRCRPHRHHGLRRRRRAARLGRPRVGSAEGGASHGPSSLFVAPGALGPRLIRIEPSPTRPASAPRHHRRRAGARGPSAARQASTETFAMPTSIAPVTLRVRAGGAPSSPQPFRFVISPRDGGFALRGRRLAGDLAAARANWRGMTRAAVLGVLAVTLLLCTGPLIDLRRQAPQPQRVPAATALLDRADRGRRAASCRRARCRSSDVRQPTPVDLLLTALTMAALVWLALDLIERRRFARPACRCSPPTAGARLAVVAGFLARGARHRRAALGVRAPARPRRRRHDPRPAPLLAAPGQRRATRRRVRAGAAARGGHLGRGRDHPPAGDPVARAARRSWRADRGRRPGSPAPSPRRRLAGSVGPSVPTGPLWVALRDRRSVRAGAGARRTAACAASRRPRGSPSSFSRCCAGPRDVSLAARARHRGQGAARRDHVRTAGGEPARGSAEAAAAGGRADRRDSRRSPGSCVSTSRPPPPDPSRAFVVWSRTDLATYRLTSAVELYSADGRLVSASRSTCPSTRRPTTAPRAARGSSRSTKSHRSDRASATCCGSRAASASSGRMVGSDRRPRDARLPHAAVHLLAEPVSRIAAARPPARRRKASRAATSSSSSTAGAARRSSSRARSVWTLPDAVFEHLVDSREPFWATLDRDDQRFRVYFLSDRGGIYALGYPVITWFGHLINLAELVMLAFALYVALLAGAHGVQRARRRGRRRAAARCCARSGRASTASCSWPSWRARSSRSSFWRSSRARTSPPSCVAGAAEAAARTVDHRAAAGRGLRRAAAARRGPPSTRSTIRSWCSSGAPSTRT